MESLEYYVDKMTELLQELIQVATKLRDASFQVISEEELGPLQKRQQALLQEIEQVDSILQKSYPNQLESATRELFHQQLQAFHHLNEEFIQNLNASHGLIQFELRNLREKEQE